MIFQKNGIRFFCGLSEDINPLFFKKSLGQSSFMQQWSGNKTGDQSAASFCYTHYSVKSAYIISCFIVSALMRTPSTVCLSNDNIQNVVWNYLRTASRLD